MALPATESFTNSDDVQLTTHSANWTLNSGNFDIQSNALAPDQATDNIAHWNADSFDNDQYAEGVIIALGNGFYIGLAVRAAAGAVTAYTYIADDDTRYVDRFVAGAWTNLATTNPGTGWWDANDVLRLEAEGTTITPLINGGADPGIAAITDSNIASGYAGVGGLYDGTQSRLDDWEGGNLGGGGGLVIPVAMHHYREMRA